MYSKFVDTLVEGCDQRAAGGEKDTAFEFIEQVLEYEHCRWMAQHYRSVGEIGEALTREEKSEKYEAKLRKLAAELDGESNQQD